MNKTSIDLENHRTKGSKVFTGRERGISVRKNTKIDVLINEYEQVEIIIPTDIMSINPSFLEEFLTNVVKSLGKDDFYKKIKFVSNSKRYDIALDLEEAVDRILRNENALSKK
ncbi:DUF4325 domain-containing protein [Flavivirga sp. 57AJ16]|uniref:STAS-like domain-containing protein n=1 Tax=Flavivirga sp. 57AJ16 TaxID=3025307 RepID=UPI002365A1A4|nr:DUF4325 domain-containing protein [Flavivirga sp. 57AJ16]MDD7887319.1 DUF4325 domain-containing protein [Flavivirga sp. 57AJ16]